MAETEGSAMEDETNFTTNVTSAADTEGEPEEDLCRTGGTGIPSLAFVWVLKVRHRPDNGKLQNMPPTSCY